MLADPNLSNCSGLVNEGRSRLLDINHVRYRVVYVYGKVVKSLECFGYVYMSKYVYRERMYSLFVL